MGLHFLAQLAHGSGAAIGRIARPFIHEPGHDEGIVGRRGRMPEQFVDLERLVKRQQVVVADILGDAVLDVQDQARAKVPFQPVAVGGLRRAAQRLALAQPEALLPGACILGLGIARGQGAEIAQKRQDRCEVRVSDLGRLQLQPGLVAVLRRSGLGAADQVVIAVEAVAPEPHQHQRPDHQHGDGAIAQDALAPHRAGILGHPPGLGEDHLAQQVVQEEALAAPRGAGPRGGHVAKAALHRAQHLVDRCAFLRARGEIEPAQHRIDLVARRPEDTLEQRQHPVLEHGNLRGKTEDGNARHAVGLLVHAVGDLGRKPRQQRVEFGPGMRQCRLLAAGWPEGGTPDLLAARDTETAEELGETGHEVGLGEKDVDRNLDPEDLVKLHQAVADGSSMSGEAVGVALQDVLEADGHDDPVHRLARAVLLEHVEKRHPALAVGLGVAVMRGVASGGVDQHRLLGEPPVAVAGAAAARHRAAGLGQRKLDARIQKRRCLARAGRADDDIPWQFVEIGRGSGGATQNRQGLLQLLAQHLAVACRTLGDDRLFQRLLCTPPPQPADQVEQRHRTPDQSDQQQPAPDTGQDVDLGNAHQRPAEPDRKREGDQPQDDQKGAQDTLHARASGVRRVIACPPPDGSGSRPGGSWRGPRRYRCWQSDRPARRRQPRSCRGFPGLAE